MKPVAMHFAAMAASALLALSGAAGAAEVMTSPGAANRNELAPSAPGATLAPGQSALESLAAAAAAGNVDAMNDLGVLYSIGGAVPLDYSKALYWYQKAIDGGSPDAMNNLGTMYLYGVGLTRDYVNAFRWFQRSAEHGNPHATYSVGVMADIGLGTSRDPALARAMYRKAAESGFTPAMVKVSDDLARRSGDGRDLVEAYAWLQVALQAGLPEELQITVLSKIDALGTRLGPGRRDEARVRASQLTALTSARGLPAQREASKPVVSSHSNFM
jgi:TPR repeat protein